MTTATPALDPRTTALLVMDFQQGLLASLPGLPDPEALLSRVLSAIADLRKHGAVIAYVRVGFTEADWAAIPPGNKTFSYLGQQRLMHYADPATDFHDKLAPEPDDITVRKTRFGALSTTDLDRQLRDRGITTLLGNSWRMPPRLPRAIAATAEGSPRKQAARNMSRPSK